MKAPLKPPKKGWEESPWTDAQEAYYVHCDNNCFARVDPVTIEEFKAALEHWRDHPWMHGCSHGC